MFRRLPPVSGRNYSGGSLRFVKILFPMILLFCLIGVYSLSNSVFDLYVMITFGVRHRK